MLKGQLLGQPGRRRTATAASQACAVGKAAAPSFSHRDTGSTGARRQQSVGNAADALLHRRHSEVHQKPKAKVQNLQVCEQLTLKHRLRLSSGLDFNDDAVIDDQIGSKSILESDTLEVEGDRLLPLDLKS